MTARTSTAEVQPAPGYSTLETALRRARAFRRLSDYAQRIAGLEAIDPDDRTTADELLLARYRRESLELQLHLALRDALLSPAVA